MSETRCACAAPRHACGLVVLTGGPGAGKTAVLEVVRRAFCEHIAILPEAATVLFGGGFPRHETDAGRRGAQNAIFHVQRSMETIVLDERHAALALCDRGTLDGLAYWPGGIEAACSALQIQRQEELGRYQAVIHLRTPSIERGYNHSNPVRSESAAQAAELDARILAAWDGHPRRVVIDSEQEFLRKLGHAVEAIRCEVPACCRRHRIVELGESTSGDCDGPG
jgi:predicted ATPase